jgi:hypothetical protein
MVRVGQRVPNFELEVYYPTTKIFGKVSLEDFMRERRWLAGRLYLCVSHRAGGLGGTLR